MIERVLLFKSSDRILIHKIPINGLINGHHFKKHLSILMYYNILL